MRPPRSSWPRASPSRRPIPDSCPPSSIRSRTTPVARRGVSSDTGYCSDDHPTALEERGIDAYIAELDYVKFLPAHPQATKIFSSAAPSPILTFAQDMVLNNKPDSTIVPKLQDDINAILKK